MSGATVSFTVPAEERCVLMERCEDPHKKPNFDAIGREKYLIGQNRGHDMGFMFMNPNPWEATYICLKCEHSLGLSLPAAVPSICPYSEV